jgi:activator of 2-hydroxyglutaryl-CoA dehydratase
LVIVISFLRVSGVAAIGIDAGSTTCKLVAVDLAGATAEDVILPRDPQLMGAYGAALLGGTA